MSFIKQIASAAALGMALLLGSGLLASPAQAGFVLTLEQQGNDVVATGSGPIDLTDLIAAGTGSNSSVILPQLGIISIGPTSSVAFYDGVIGPTSFGSVPSQPLPDSVSGNFIGIFGIGGRLGVPLGYLSGDPLSGTSTWVDETFSSLGVTPGTYEWTWGRRENQNFTLIIGVVPEPASTALLGAALAGLLLAGTIRRMQPGA